MNIIELSQNERDKAIENILSEGLSNPRSLWRYLYEIYRTLGFRYTFMNTTQSMIMTVAATVGFMMLYPLSPEHYIYATLFAIAPVFFIFMMLFSETIERIGGLYALKMTYKYTVQQVAALRVLCFALMGAVFCLFISLYFSRLPVAYDFFRAFSLSLCALFLCAFLTLFIRRSCNEKWIHWAITLLWMAIGLLPTQIFSEQWERFLSQIPVTITVLVGVIACALFVMEINRLIYIRKREVAYDAGH